MMAAAMGLLRAYQAMPSSDSPDARCAKLAIQTLGSGFNPADYTFIGGAAGADDFSG